MENKIKTLEHLDGKQVRYSTLTSQHPEIFVERKRNTGELIITTDTEPKYGMHHIYVGGEHIACGYGFATKQTRDDLCYVQETYNGIFNYFNNAYTYHTNAYNWLKSYVLDSYAYIVDSILYNSYVNTKVDEKYNKITVDNTTYILTFNNGILYALYNIDSNIIFNGDNEVLLDLNKNNYIYGNANSKEMEGILYKASIKIINGYGDYSTITSDNIQNVVLTGYESNSLNNIYNNFTLSTISNLNLTEITKNTLKNDTFFDVPIFKNIDTSLYIDYLKPNNIGDTTIYKTDTVKYVWIKPIYFLITDSASLITEELCKSKPDNTILFNYKNKKTLTNILVNITDTNTTNYDKNIYKKIYICLPNEIRNPKFYFSDDISKKGSNEGGMCQAILTDTNYTEDTLFDGNYTIYSSDKIYFNKSIRIDIDF